MGKNWHQIKKIIVLLIEDGKKARYIADLLGRNESTIYRFLKRIREQGKIENLPQKGRPQKITDRASRKLLRIVKKIVDNLEWLNIQIQWW